MFKTPITTSPLISAQADTVLGRISGGSYFGDVSFLSTLRALVFPRMPEGDAISFSVSRSNYSEADAKRYNSRELADLIASKNSRIGTTGGFALHYFDSTDKIANEKSMNAIMSKFEEVRSGYKRVDKITAFYKQFPVACYINEELKAVALFVGQMDHRRYHFIQAAIVPAMPWYFTPGQPLTPLEMSVIHAVTDRTKDENDYNDAIRKIYDTFDFRSELIRRKLSGFETAFIRDALAVEQRNYANKIDRINQLNRQIADAFREQNDISIRIAGMERKIEEGGDDSELMEYFLASKNLTLTEVSGSTVHFIVRSNLEYFDPEAAKAAIDNPNARLYSRCRNISSNNEDLKKLWTAIFLDEKLRINVCARFSLSLDGGVSTNGGHGSGFGAEFNDCLPHPHVEYYNCMGGYVQIINELMMKHDYIMAIEQCVASCQSLNFNDGTVIGKFCEVMSGDDTGNNRCVVLPDGKVVTPREAIAWLKEQE